MKVSTVLDSIDQGNVALPEFQRGYVWGREQVRQLMKSLYNRYPVGGLLVWETHAEATATRGAGASAMVVKLLLDGQQRMTTLYGVMRGHPPTFFQGDERAFLDLYFHLEDEVFEFYGPVKMKADPLWVDVTALFKEGLQPWFARFGQMDLDAETFGRYMERLNRITGIAEIDLHLDEIATGLTVDDVVDIFNRVNSGGTKLSKGDLALARICAAWPDARKTMVDRLDGWREHGFDFTLDWLLRVTNALLTGEALFSALKDVEPQQFQTGLTNAGASIDDLLNLVSGRLGLDHDRVLGGRYAFPVMARYWADTTTTEMTEEERGKLLYWYLHAALWGRHSGSTESTLNQDLEALERGGLDALIQQLRIWRGDLTVRAENLTGAYRGSRFYPLIYMLSRVHGARDFATGNPVSSHLLGKLSRLELHHIFPKALLQEHGYDRSDRNALGNFCFITQETNLAIGRKDPAEYLAKYEAQNPGVLASQWIPDDPELWQPERYHDFLAARRKLLAAAANEFLASLIDGSGLTLTEPESGSRERQVIEDPESAALLAIAREAVSLGLAEPEVDHEVTDIGTGEVLAWADLAWPDGVRVGLTDPVAYLAERDEELERRFGELGWRFYTDVARLRRYFEEVLGVDLDGDGIVGNQPEPESGDDNPSPIHAEQDPQPSAAPQGSAGITSFLTSIEESLDECRRTLESFPYREDPRNPPDEARRGRFRSGWKTAAAGETYGAAALQRLTWDNLGWRLGDRYGSQPDDLVDRVFDRFADLWHADLRGSTPSTQATAPTDRPGRVDDQAADAPGTEAEFHQAMIDLYERAKREAGYPANYLLQSISERGGLATAQHLLRNPHPSQGFTELWERRRLDLSVEALALQPRFQHLFTDVEARTARRWLSDHGYEPGQQG